MIFKTTSPEKNYLSRFSSKQFNIFTFFGLLLGDILTVFSIKLAVIDQLKNSSPTQIAASFHVFKADINQALLDPDFYQQLIQIYIQMAFVFVLALLLVNFFNYFFYFYAQKKWAFQYLKFLSSTGCLLSMIGFFFDFNSLLGVVNLGTALVYFILFRLFLFKETITTV